MWSSGGSGQLGLKRGNCIGDAILAAVLVILTFFGPAIGPARADGPCRSLQFEETPFTACVADPRRHTFRLLLKRPDATAYGDLAALPQDGLLFATNAGMFAPDFSPAGLYIEDGKTLKPLNTVVSGFGNFHMQPNGVFWISDGTAGVTPTAKFAKLKTKVDIATQSGPMLVIGGAVNAKFEANGSSLHVRNGVGVDAQGRVAVAISEVPVSFGRFARFFREALGCPNALYLDGSVSDLLVAGKRSPSGGRRLGPLLGVYAQSTAPR